MKKNHLRFLACPECEGDLTIDQIDADDNNSIAEGALRCQSCSATFPIVRHVPRFVPPENYAAGFGFQWNKHAKTQLDSYTGTNVTERRFFAETRWPRDLRGEVVLEVGGGAGRFTEQCASTGAMTISVDYSLAVEANHANNGHKDNVLIVQGDLYALPFKKDFFDKLYCLGVLQHTPDVAKSFSCLPRHLKPGGRLAVDVYQLRWWTYLLVTQRWLRPLTRRLPATLLYALISRWVRFVWPMARVLVKLTMKRPIILNLLLSSQ